MRPRGQRRFQRDGEIHHFARQCRRQGDAVRAVHVVVGHENQSIAGPPGRRPGISYAPGLDKPLAGRSNGTVGVVDVGIERGVVQHSGPDDLNVGDQQIAEELAFGRAGLPGGSMAARLHRSGQFKRDVRILTRAGRRKGRGRRSSKLVVAGERECVSIAPG